MKRIHINLYMVCILLFFNLPNFAQNITTPIETILNKEILIATLKFPNELKELYQGNQFHNIWIHESDDKILLKLLALIRDAEESGLKQEDYQPALFAKYSSIETTNRHFPDSTWDDIKFSDAAIQFLHDLESGNLGNLVSYNGLNYAPSCNNLSQLLRSYINSGRLSLMTEEIDLKDEGFKALKNKLHFFCNEAASKNFSDAIITSKEINQSNIALIARLLQLGINEGGLKENIKKAAILFDNYNKTVITSNLLKELNVPLKSRIASLTRAMNTMRWLKCIKQDSHIILVNIPSANLKLFEYGKLVLESNIIVGKKATPTPTLSSKITEVVIYPYWHVPGRIATHELLPSIKRNPQYLEANNFQLLDKKGKLIKASTVNWKNINAYNFPYEIRQSTGCDNSLGLVKLNFYNPFSVYLHDTPAKGLFNSHKRYLSHGCMRLQKAVELAHYVVKGNTKLMDSLIAKGCLKMQAPIIIPASEIIPVFVLYNTAWINGSFEVIFSQDIYDKYIY